MKNIKDLLTPKDLLIAGGILLAVFLGYLALRPGVQTRDLQVGIGTTAEKGSQVLFHYEGFVRDSSRDDQRGVEFDSTYKRQLPQKAVLGEGQLIDGLEQGLSGMQAGGKRIILVPSRKAYARAGAAGGLIPPNADLVYVVEMKHVQAP